MRAGVPLLAAEGLTVLRGAVPILRGVGLDSTVKECGLAVLTDPAPLLDLACHDPRVRIYRPISEKIRAAS